MILPAGYDILWTVVVVPLLVLTMVALASLFRSPKVVGLSALFWLLLILFVPVLGALAWFGRGSRIDRRSVDDEERSDTKSAVRSGR